MNAFLVPYEIHFDDTMAYGSHHFLTNFKFQCSGREHLLFSDALYRDPAFREDFDKVILYTAEAYSRNLGPAQLGDRLSVLTTVEERTAIGLRFCFRTLREDGEPVACGYQTVLCASRVSGQIVAFPASFNRCFDQVSAIVEPTEELSFRERVHRGGKDVRGLFPEAVRAMVRSSWAGGRPQPGIYGASGAAAVTLVIPTPMPAPTAPALSLPPDARALLMGGQGTFDVEVLLQLVRALPDARGELDAVVGVTRASLGLDVRPLLRSRADAEAALAQAPDLDQIGIFLTGVLAARALVQQGRAPQLLIGHSFGEIAALTAGGVLTLRDGAEAVCQRVLALRGCEGLGTLAAVGLSAGATRDILAALGLPLSVAGVNHAGQTVVAGPRQALEQLVTALAAQARPVTIVPSRYPFHTEALRPAADRYAAALAALPTSAPQIPVWSPIDGRLYTGAPGEVAAALAGHLVRPFDFLDALTRARDAGARTFYDAAGGRLGRIVSKALGESARVATVDLPAPTADDRIAIVSLGCLFPGGARDPEAYWSMLRRGDVGVTEAPELVADFVAEPLQADKALTTLAGRVDDGELVAPAGCAAFAGWSRVQRLLAVALAQCDAGLRSRPAADRVRCLLGSTADGSDALDDALTVESLDLDPASAAALTRALGARSSGELAPHTALQAVVQDRLGPVTTTLVDAACASSLYTVALGAAILRSGDADLVLAGGAFAPGPGNNCLFSQFRGLSTRAIRPFDAEADGVIFGEGAGLVALKRLADAERDGDRIHAVITGIGLSSDGRSSSANVPRAEGQLLAVQRAWDGLDASTVEYVEAHGTATPAGDGTELDALHRFFGPRVSRRVPIGSVKAQTGHLGWVAGTASLIKLCKMLEHDLIPRQHAFTAPGKPLLKVADRFEVLTSERPWPRQAEPRRAATSGFGFGGTNAHIVVEDYLPGRPGRSAPRAQGLAVVAATSLLPDAQGAPSVFGYADAFSADAVQLPDGVRALPDLVEDMDVTQRLAVRGAHALLAGLAQPGLKAQTSLVLGLEGKTERGVEAICRVMGTRVERLLRAAEARREVPAGAAANAAAAVAKLRPSTGYTLQGMMPNVTPGRVANLLDLQGPNLVIDEGRSTLSSALDHAARLLDLGSELVLAGGVHHGRHVARDGRAPAGDGLVLLALTTPEIAAARGLPVLGLLEMQPGGAAAPGAIDRRGAEGGAALVKALEGARHGEVTRVALGGATWVVSPAGGPRPTERAPVARPAPEATVAVSHLSPPSAAAAPAAPAAVAPAGPATPAAVAPAAPAASASPGFGVGSPVRYATPILIERAAGAAQPWLDRRVVVLTDGPVGARAADALRAAGAAVTLLNAADLDLSSETTAEPALAQLGAPDVLLAVRELAPLSLNRLVRQATTDRALLDLTFLAARRLYPRLLAGQLDVVALHIGGLGADRRLHPTTGQLAGMLKSVAREAPVGRVRVTSTSHDDLVLAVDQVSRELGARDAVHARNVESAWDGDLRLVRVLGNVPVASTGPSPLGPDSVVIATGGARGVTAVLVEALLKKHGCTVILLGRTEEGGAPPELLAAAEHELDGLEQAFYAAEVARDPSARIGDLRRRFERYRSAHELHHTLARLRALPGEVIYRKADVTSAADVDLVLDEVGARHGRLDLIIHGAGLQTSKKLDRRKLDELRRNMDVKLLGLQRLHAAAVAHFGPVPFHVLTSAFSYFGNDGQADYGAANETLDRLCTAAPGWTSIGWLAWDRIGMTRSPEYAVLGAARNLRGIGADEGADLFLQVVDGRPTTAIYHQLTDGEIAWYDLEVVDTAPQVTPITFDAESLSCLDDHVVRGTPTVPGAWSLDRMLPVALPGGGAAAIEDIRFSRFVRVPRGTRQELRVSTSRGPGGTEARLSGDIRHKSGAVLQADVEHAAATFRPLGAPPTAELADFAGGVNVEDPYCAPDAPITLSNGFNCLRDIRVGPEGRVARFVADGPNGARHLPALLLDAAWRLSAMHAEPDIVYAPVRFQRVSFTADALSACSRPITIRATPPRVDGEVVHCDRVEAVDPEGRVILAVDGGLARRIP